MKHLRQTVEKALKPLLIKSGEEAKEQSIQASRDFVARWHERMLGRLKRPESILDIKVQP